MRATDPKSDWLRRAVVYEIYPQSFADSDGDGIGDLPGALARLDHLAWLGVDTVWFNPCFASPFVDAGYDVADYLTVAPRYGTNDDLVAFMDAARERGIRVLLDLVVGHTSVDHAWFRAEAGLDGPDPLGDRYIWATDGVGDDVSVLGEKAWVPSPGRRPGHYLKNFFDAQPALNFGYARPEDGEPWRQPVDAPGPVRNRRMLQEVMSHWLDLGAAGFRVDMAFSLVKDDEGLVETTKLWREMRDWLDATYPDAVIVPEGSEPRSVPQPAFDADFFLVIHAPHASLFDNGGAGRLPHHEPGPCYFDEAGLGGTEVFLRAWNRVRDARPGRPILLASADHDYSRLACGDRTGRQLRVAFAFLLTWASVPSIYFGDEIGLRYQPDAPDKEGAICWPGLYNRAGCRTPMQWDDGPNAGFSTAPAERLYLPVDPSPDRPTVAAQLADPASLLHLVRDLISLRKAVPDIGASGEVEVLHGGYPFVYRRGAHHLVVVNPRRDPATADVPYPRLVPLRCEGVRADAGTIHADGVSFGIFRIDPV